MKKISLDEMKRMQLDILKDVHRFCIENNIHYTLIFGTLLGAIRHKGYIPWDDDIDIAMMRPDYEKFVAHYKHKDGWYHVYDFRKDKDYHNPYAKVADTRTLLEENVSTKNIGVNIDVFPFDYMFDKKDDCKNFILSLNRLKTLFRIKLVKPGKKNSWWKRILIRLSKIAVLPWSIRSITEMEYAKIGDLNNPSAQWIAMAVDPEKEAAIRSISPRSTFEKFIEVPFEDGKFMAIADYDQWLTGMYGDYMTPPANKDRTSPHTLSNIYWI